MSTTPAAKTQKQEDQSPEALVYRMMRELPLAEVLRYLSR